MMHVFAFVYGENVFDPPRLIKYAVAGDPVQ